jgi:hypothetical protein
MDHSFSTLPLAIALLISAFLFLAAQPQHFDRQVEVVVSTVPFCSDDPACRAKMEGPHPPQPRNPHFMPTEPQFKQADPNWDRA